MKLAPKDPAMRHRHTILRLVLALVVSSCASSPSTAPPTAPPPDGAPVDQPSAEVSVAPDGTVDAPADGTVDAPPDGTVDAPAAQPNFVLILAEATGWTSTSVVQDDSVPASRSGTVETPNLARVAAQGMRFSNFYAPSPRCMPTRASLLTGVSPAALHMTFIPEAMNDGDITGSVVPPTPLTTLPAATPTVASVLRGAGYATAHFGKWHAGNVDPAMYGFDRSDGATANRGPENVDHPNPAQAYSMTDRALAFVDAQVAARRPFYLQVSTYGGKDQVDALPETWAAASARLPGANPRAVAVAATQMDMDVNLGRLLARLDALGIAGNTYVIFTSDHGAQGPNSNPPLQEGKGTVWEGGIRVPLIVRGPGVRMGVAARMRASGVDLLPTIASLAGVRTPLPTNLEGASLVETLRDGTTAPRRVRDEFVVHFPHYDHDPLGPASTILVGEYKLTRFYETGSLRLFNLATDLGETTDLAARDPARVADMDRRLSDYLTAVQAQMPTRR